MAHHIQRNDGLLLVGKRAWHGLGTVLPEAVDPMAALKVARLDWEVEESFSLTAKFQPKEYTEPMPVTEVEVTSHKTLRRSDDRSVLSTVGSDYCVLQNKTLAEIATSLGQQGKVDVETAGSLFGGQKVWFLIRSNTIDVATRGDFVHQYLLLVNSHDGTMSATILPTKIRVVCNNTMTMAMNSGDAAYRWRHTSGLSLRIDDIKTALRQYGKIAHADEEAIHALGYRMMGREEIQELWVDVLQMLDGPIPSNPKTEQEHIKRNKATAALANMARVFDAESQRFGATAWVAANAMTNYIQFHRGSLKGESRMNSDLFGAYANAKKTAMRKTLELGGAR